MEETIRSEQIQVERKIFFFDLKENQRGRFLRITEDVNGRRDTIILPAPGVAEFIEVLQSLAEDCEQGPPQGSGNY
ncbi:MAG: PUR family DNA/RNA-binding protein [Candidatus Methylacidiphilales bacterium]|nr:PUR family DNA/RNA-binding protein [Candidatus Methylacidiphilales bacterium]